MDTISKTKFTRYVISKWRKTLVLLKKSELRSHIPDTRIMTRSTLHEMLRQYGMVYIKPDKGTYGNGVMRVELDTSRLDTPYRYHYGLKISGFAHYDDMYNEILKQTKQRAYLVQKGIHLTRFRNRRFDIRVMVQQSPQQKWETTGVIGRVAHPGKVVTNVHNGGELKPVEKLLDSYPERARKQCIRLLQELGLKTAHQLHSRFRGIKEVGLDVALDANLHPWVLEVNTCPDPYIFKRLKDKRVFAKVFRYAKAYRRV